MKERNLNGIIVAFALVLAILAAKAYAGGWGSWGGSGPSPFGGRVTMSVDGQTFNLNAAGTSYITGVLSGATTSFVGQGALVLLQPGSNGTASTEVARVGDADGYESVFGGGLTSVTRATAVIANPTDTTTAPSSTEMGISAAAVAAWTPSETGAKDGSIVRVTNTGAFAITMTDSAAIYEGGAAACVLGQWDSAQFAYFSDRWVELSCRDN